MASLPTPGTFASAETRPVVIAAAATASVVTFMLLGAARLLSRRRAPIGALSELPPDKLLAGAEVLSAAATHRDNVKKGHRSLRPVPDGREPRGRRTG